MQKRKVNRNTKFFLLMVGAFVLLMLSAANINNITSEKKVLGAESQNNTESEFWEGFLLKNPNYIPGWIEINQIDKARGINPNYQLP